MEANLPDFLSLTKASHKDNKRLTFYFNNLDYKFNIIKCPADINQCQTYQMLTLNIKASLAQSISNYQKRAKQRYHKAYWILKKLSPPNVPWNDEAIIIAMNEIYDIETEA